MPLFAAGLDGALWIVLVIAFTRGRPTDAVLLPRRGGSFCALLRCGGRLLTHLLQCLLGGGGPGLLLCGHLDYLEVPVHLFDVAVINVPLNECVRHTLRILP